ncbi:MAG: hypothetical protein SWJ54_14620 [Cyanobacteriota bacterium]|nr:hypothetical protein [Cyanobacteriota bacterium]
MQNIARSRGSSRGPIANLSGDEPIDLMSSLLGDLTNISRSRNPAPVLLTQDTNAYETSTMAVLSAVLEVVG